MALRTIAQVAVGAVAGAALVAIPTWAAASQQDEPAPTQFSQMSDMMGMMADMPGMEGTKACRR